MAPPSPPVHQWRLMAALFGGLVIVTGGAYFFLFRQDYAVLYQDLREDDAAAVTRALEAENIRYRLANSGADILVPATDLDQIRLDIASSDVAVNGLEGFELFDESDMGLTDFGQRIKYQRALQGELARTIMRMDGVVDARVHVSIPERTLFRNERRSAEAAVTLVTRRSEDLTTSRVEGIRRLVAAAVADLSPADVVVLDGRGQPLLGTEIENNAMGHEVIDPAAEVGHLARQAVHRAIPYRRFDLNVLTPPMPLEGAAASTEEATTTFHLVTESSLSEAERERVENELQRTGLTPDEQDLVFRFDVGPVAPDARQADPSPTMSTSSDAVEARQAPSDEPPTPFFPWLWLGFAVMGLLGGVAIVWRLVTPRLSLSERQSFAEALRTSLREQSGVQHDGA